MKPAPFAYRRAETLGYAVELIAELGEEAKLLAGGQSLVPLINLRLARPEFLVDLNFVQGLAAVRRENGMLAVGAMVRQRVLETSEEIAQAVPLLRLVVPHLGHAAIRNRGTVGGSLVHADPAAELPLVLVTLGGAVRARSRDGERKIAAEELYRSSFSTSLAPGEILTEALFPASPPDASFGFCEFARRRGDFALVAVACVLRRDDQGTVSEACIGVGGIGSTPLLLRAAGQVLVGTEVDAQAVEQAAALAAESAGDASDIHASADYRRRLAAELARRAIRQATSGKAP